MATSLETTPIPGLVVVRLPVHEDAAAGSRRTGSGRRWPPSACPTSGRCRTTSPSTPTAAPPAASTPSRGTSSSRVATGRVFGAWVDMREGDSFGTTFHVEIDPSVAVFVPRGVGNSYQTLEDGTAYTYLVNDHWRPATPTPR